VLIIACVAKIDGRTLDHKSLEHMRILAVRRVVDDGEDPSEVMRSLGLKQARLIAAGADPIKIVGPQAARG